MLRSRQCPTRLLELNLSDFLDLALSLSACHSFPPLRWMRRRNPVPSLTRRCFVVLPPNTLMPSVARVDRWCWPNPVAPRYTWHTTCVAPVHVPLDTSPPVEILYPSLAPCCVPAVPTILVNPAGSAGIVAVPAKYAQTTIISPLLVAAIATLAALADTASVPRNCHSFHISNADIATAEAVAVPAASVTNAISIQICVLSVKPVITALTEKGTT